MTIQEMEKSTKLYLTAEDIAPYLQCDPQAIRITARNHPDWLGFPVVCTEHRVKIPRKPFLRFLGRLEIDDGNSTGT